MDITTLANLFVRATRDEQQVEDFMAAWLRENATVLVFSTIQIASAMWQEWLDSLPSDRMYTMPEKMQEAKDLHQAVQDYLISNPEIFHYSKHGWRVDRKRFFNQQADIITV
jgi:hypothetical protein